MAVKKSTYRVDNGSGWDEHMLKTTADQVIMANGINLEEGFRVSKGTNGYTKLPNGLIIQWGCLDLNFNNSSSAGNTAHFPVKFPHGILGVVGNCRTNDSGAAVFNVSCSTNSLTYTNLRAYSMVGNISGMKNFNYVAIGY